MLLKKYEIAPQSAVAVEVLARQHARIVNSSGGQVVDTWAFNRHDLSEHLSMAHSHSATYHLLFQPGDCLVTDRFNPIVTIISDTSPGQHDTLHAACSVGSNRYYGADESNHNCEDNLKNILRTLGGDAIHIPCPWNLFEHVEIAQGYRLTDMPSTAAAGDYIEIRAEMDVLLVCSACPSMVGNISGDSIRGATVELIDPSAEQIRASQ